MILKAQSLTILRGARIIHDGLSFEVAGGEALLVTGPNGVGKTTLIRTIAGFLSAERGTIVLEGGAEDLDVAQQAHYVGHLTGIKSSLTAVENLDFWGTYLAPGRPYQAQREAIWSALERFQLSSLADIPAGLMSAGQKRRLGLARLLIAERPLWLLDEPTVSLDAASTEALAGLIKAHVDGGGLVMAATHLPLGLANPRTLALVRHSHHDEAA